jgi:hypothetical protein
MKKGLRLHDHHLVSEWICGGTLRPYEEGIVLGTVNNERGMMNKRRRKEIRDTSHISQGDKQWH